MDKIFISYRREDSEGFARGLFQSLSNRFGKDKVFMDVEAIALGMDFMEAIDNSLADCGALLVLIGKDWTSCKDADGVHRLKKEKDLVRTEVARAIKQKLRVIPVLVKGAPMPGTEDLPEDLQPLTRRQALKLRHESWDPDVEHLASTLEKILNIERIDKDTHTGVPPQQAPKKRSKIPMFLSAIVALFLVFGTLVYRQINRTMPVYSVPEQSASIPEVKKSKPVKATPVKPSPVKPTAVNPIPKPAQITHISGVWMDDNGSRVDILQTGTTAFSQAIDQSTGVLIQANWILNGRQCEFNWRAATGNQGYGRGIISADFKVINYEFVDYSTGLQDTGRLVRSGR